jgi:hypothetical protein
MALGAKIKVYILYYCPSEECNVAMFVRNTKCPSCGADGYFVRDPLTNMRGTPSTRPLV